MRLAHRHVALAVFLPWVAVIVAAFVPPRQFASAAADPPKPTQTDLNILRKADEILGDESKWNRKCERRYTNEDKTWSLYTALHKASLETTGKFDHRQPALEEVRKTVESLTTDKKYQHRLMDYNNDPDTEFADIKKVLKTTKERVAAQVEKNVPKK